MHSFSGWVSLISSHVWVLTFLSTRHCSSATPRLHTGLPVRCAMRYPQAATTSRRCAALNRPRIAAGKCGNFNPCTRINASNFKRNWNEAVNRGTRHRTPSSERKCLGDPYHPPRHAAKRRQPNEYGPSTSNKNKLIISYYGLWKAYWLPGLPTIPTKNRDHFPEVTWIKAVPRHMTPSWPHTKPKVREPKVVYPKKRPTCAAQVFWSQNDSNENNHRNSWFSH